MMFDKERKEELIMAKQIRQGTAVIKSRKSLKVTTFEFYFERYRSVIVELTFSLNPQKWRWP